MSRQGKIRERTWDNVKQFWENEAKQWGDNPQVTVRDHCFRLLEINTITKLIENKNYVLDIGCGNGFGTLYFSKVVDEIIGIDYSKNMIKWANRFLRDKDYYEKTTRHFALDGIFFIGNNIQFEVGDILDIKYPTNTFDSVVAERVLINLPERELQDNAIGEVYRVMKPGSLYIVLEPTEQGYQNINKFRTSYGIAPMERYWHNLPLDEDHFISSIREKGFNLQSINRFETYQFLTKVVHSWISRDEKLEFISPFNNAARIISNKYPTYQSVKNIGFDSFFNDKFKEVLTKCVFKRIDNYTEIANEIVKRKPDFSLCSHTAMFILEK